MIRPKYLIIIADILLACLCLVGAYLLRFGSVDSLNMLLGGGDFQGFMLFGRGSSFLVFI